MRSRQSPRFLTSGGRTNRDIDCKIACDGQDLPVLPRSPKGIPAPAGQLPKRHGTIARVNQQT